jgi:hypothetical protein
MSKTKVFIAAALALGVSSSVTAQQQPAAPPQLPASTEHVFFVNRRGPRQGRRLGGIEGADQHCQTVAARHGAGGKTWRAYLSTQAGRREARGQRARPHRQRPVAELQGPRSSPPTWTTCTADNNKLGFDNSLSERGQIIPGVGFAPNRHDVLTGSTPEGRAFPAAEDRTCRTGRAAPRARRWSAISTARAARRRRVEVVEFDRIPRAGPTAAAARAICAAPAGTDCSTASPLSKAGLTPAAIRGWADKARPRFAFDANQL